MSCYLRGIGHSLFPDLIDSADQRRATHTIRRFQAAQRLQTTDRNSQLPVNIQQQQQPVTTPLPPIYFACDDMERRGSRRGVRRQRRHRRSHSL